MQPTITLLTYLIDFAILYIKLSPFQLPSSSRCCILPGVAIVVSMALTRSHSVAFLISPLPAASNAGSLHIIHLFDRTRMVPPFTLRNRDRGMIVWIDPCVVLPHLHVAPRPRPIVGEMVIVVEVLIVELREHMLGALGHISRLHLVADEMEEVIPPLAHTSAVIDTEAFNGVLQATEVCRASVGDSPRLGGTGCSPGALPRLPWPRGCWCSRGGRCRGRQEQRARESGGWVGA